MENNKFIEGAMKISNNSRRSNDFNYSPQPRESNFTREMTWGLGTVTVVGLIAYCGVSVTNYIMSTKANDNCANLTRLQTPAERTNNNSNNPTASEFINQRTNSINNKR